MNHFTSIEQSKKLLELGLKPETADMWWSRCCITDFDNGKGLSVGYSVEPVNLSQFKYTDKDIPCWSFKALLDVLPENYLFIKNYNNTYEISVDTICAFISTEKETAIDLLVYMVSFLLQNNYIKTE